MSTICAVCCCLHAPELLASHSELSMLNWPRSATIYYVRCAVDFCQSSTNNLFGGFYTSILYAPTHKSRVCPMYVPSQHFGNTGSSVANQITTLCGNVTEVNSTITRCPSFGRIHCKVWTWFFCFNPPYSSCEKGCDIFLV